MCMHGINGRHQQWYTKEPTSGHQNCKTSQILIFFGYVKVRESLCAQLLICFNNILTHDAIRANFPRYEGSCLLYRPKDIINTKYYQIHCSTIIFFYLAQIEIFNYKKRTKTQPPQVNQHNLGGNQDIVPIRCPTTIKKCGILIIDIGTLYIYIYI